MNLFETESLLSKITGVESVVSTLNIRERNVLRLLEEDQFILIKKIRESLKIDADKLSRVLKSLENHHDGTNKTPLIERGLSNFDKRLVVISLTPYGGQILKEEHEKRTQLINLLLSKLSESEQVTFGKLINKMNA